MKHFCKHYRALAFHDTCEIGIAYASVSTPNPEGPGAVWPCWGYQTQTCASILYPTPEEIKAQNEAIARAVTKFADDLANNVCPHCSKAIQTKKQVGRCVYAYPCGCRLYQGRL